MDIGLLMAVRNHPAHPRPLPEVYEEYITDAVRAEALGFDHVWVGEHRMTEDQWTPSPMLVLTAIAARTGRIRLGSSVMCLPFHHPLRLAEDLVVLDNISGGRVDFGFGVGSQFEEFRTFGVPSGKRLGITYEAARFIERCFTEEGTFSHHGKYFDIPEVTFTTRPVQERIPFYAAAIGPQSLELAARNGYHLIAQRQPLYDRTLREDGREPEAHQAIPLQMVCVAPTREEALEASLEGLHHFANFYRLRRNIQGELPDPSVEIPPARIAEGDLGHLGRAAVGSPDEVTETLLGILKEKPGTTGFALAFRHAGMRAPEVARSMELFAREVMPHLPG
ncbi:LLM class flavin-dependent oxidoreductase [Streptomyces sp. NPDC048288]|uniref:LLM class flavin-dependent oxidoreductase n=1 Tax=Streptomyces sp. NPDC048288 TaxID=3365529 RepID=UPI003715F66F